MASSRHKRIIIFNADDLGYTSGINRTIELCARAGVLRSATLMANGPAFDNAVDLAGRNPDLGIGVHLVLTELKPVTAPEELAGLVDEGGFLPSAPGLLLKRLIRESGVRDAVRKELDSQVAKVLDAGIRPTHLDSHKHVHAIPQVLEAVVEIARKYSIRWIRNPFESDSFVGAFTAVERNNIGPLCKQHLKVMLYSVLRPSFDLTVRSAGLRMPDHFFGVSLTGIWNEAAMRGTLSRLPPGVSEWMLHPGECDGELQRMSTRLLEEREMERNLLLSPLLRELISEHHIVVSRYGEEFGE